MSAAILRVGAIVLTHNSSEDLPDCIAGLILQKGVDLRVIVVDNASQPDERARMEANFCYALPDGRVLPAANTLPEDLATLPAMFLRNEVNGGYSAGNNIGARLAVAIGCDAVLIINPDVRISEPSYVATLCEEVLAGAKTAVACSMLRNLSGEQENPMTEPSFVQELLWPVKMIAVGLFRSRKTVLPLPDSRCRVDKVSGACFMIRTDFLLQVGFFDETVFLYCEESILMAQVRMAGRHMVMIPNIEALHAHRSDVKGDPLRRFQVWTKSRSQFHKFYGVYNIFGQTLLAVSRRMTLELIRGRGVLKQLRKWFSGKIFKP